MDNYELRPEPKVKRKSPVWDILTVLILLVLCGVSYLFFTIFTNPYSNLNPFQPEAFPTKFSTSTPTFTPMPLEPTWTPTVTLQPSPSRTKAPTWTPLPIETPKAITLAVSPTFNGTPPTATITVSPIALAEVTYQASTTAHPDLGCNWMGVGGKVVDAEGKPLTLYVVQLGGNLGSVAISDMQLSGQYRQDPYGQSGFEFVLGNKPVASTGEVWIFLSDNINRPLSEKIYLNLKIDCTKNLAFVTFTVNK